MAILALSDNHRQSRKWLQSQLWSESNEIQGAGSLRQELARLKSLLGDAIQADRIDIWLEPQLMTFDHLGGSPPVAPVELLQGIDIEDEAFEDWLREMRQAYDSGQPLAEAPVAETPWARHPVVATGVQQSNATQQCTIIFDCDAKGSLDANVASLFFSEMLYKKLSQYDVFSCVGYGSETADALRAAAPSKPDQYTIVARIIALARGDEVYLGVQLDSGILGRRLSFQSTVLPGGISRLHESTDIGHLVESTAQTLLDSMRFDMLPEGGQSEALLLSHEAKRLMFKLDKDSLQKADGFLARAYQIDPRGEYVGWRGFLRNTAFFQHRDADIFSDRHSSDELSLEALRQSPENAIVQAFSSQLEYVNQGNLTEPMIKAQRAVEIDRSDPLARALLSNALTVNGFLEEAYTVAQQAIALAAGSRFEFYFHHFACMAATAASDYEAGLRHARSAVSYVPDFVSPRRYEVILALKLGDTPGVERAVTAMQRMEPNFEVGSLLDMRYPVNTLRRLPIIDAIT